MKTKLINLIKVSFFTLFCTILSAQELTIYILPSPVDRKWESPSELIGSTIKNIIYPENYKKRILGHVFIKLSKGDESYITGSSAAPDVNLKNLVIKNGYGLGILNADIKGQLESKEKLSYELAMRYKHGNISFLRFKISDEVYERLETYLVEYEKREYDKIYNGENKPREGKGAGCSAFAVSFLEVAGFLQEAWKKEWMVEAKVPSTLIGEKLIEYKVGILKIFRNRSWAKKNEAYVETCFYDPNAMHKWVLGHFKKKTNDEARILKTNKAIGLEFDFSDRDCPKEAIFIQTDDLVVASQ
jgi:hypothetical protein